MKKIIFILVLVNKKIFSNLKFDIFFFNLEFIIVFLNILKLYLLIF